MQHPEPGLTVFSARRTIIVLISSALFFSGCGDNSDGLAAETFLEQVQGVPYDNWESPGDFDSRQPSFTAHADEVRVFMSPDMSGLHVGIAQCRTAKEAAENRGEPYPRTQVFTVAAWVDSNGDGVQDPGEEVTEWPEGSRIVKEAYSGGSLAHTALMIKRDNGWFYAEYNSDDEPIFSGHPNLCIGCHSGAQSDFVFTANLHFVCPTPEELEDN